MAIKLKDRASDFQFFLETIGNEFLGLAVFNESFECLNVKSKNGESIFGLTHSLKSLKPLLRLDRNHIYIVNDPILGCSRVDRVHFIFSIGTFHFIAEVALPVKHDFNIRIPPVPLYENGTTNEALLSMLCAGGLDPESLKNSLNQHLKNFESFKQSVQDILNAHPDFAKKEFQTDYLTNCYTEALEKIESKTFFSQSLDYMISSDSTLKAKVFTSETGIGFDFHGTTLSKIIQFPEVITDSICIDFFAQYFQFSHKLNSMTLKLFQITKPLNSMLNMKKIENRLYSELVGSQILRQFLFDIMSKVSGSKFYSQMRPIVILNSGAELDSEILSPKVPRKVGSLALRSGFNPLLNTFALESNQNLQTPKALWDHGLKATRILGHFISKENLNPEIDLEFKTTRDLEIKFFNIPSVKSSKLVDVSNHTRITVGVNGQLMTDLTGTLALKTGDLIQFKTIHFQS